MLLGRSHWHEVWTGLLEWLSIGRGLGLNRGHEVGLRIWVVGRVCRRSIVDFRGGASSNLVHRKLGNPLALLTEIALERTLIELIYLILLLG